MNKYSSLLSIVYKSSLALTAWATTTVAYGQIYQGGGIQEGATLAGDIVGSNDLRTTVINIIKEVLSYMALIAVVVIVIAGIRLVVSQGEDEPKEKAKKTIMYTVIGLIIILFARVLVQIFVDISNAS
ncbi:hypothetical protein HN512_02360 [Candidatus Peregrinibacteria bacterium]|jgi:hypothetical protein|nr:hypothetical protein [Candidatus Peregrinibacteria bacterium]MBT3598657.1 hypothetical protein [Candidatus Peregrinibacteria bacterium]MBT4367309.1 hypothetical protein [Candidatus Peregrinibacteria bacterium]MBT4586056.1 hypothetical protein [Candidatus Peregrinibacteria bacterium]MBT6730944.1 hypothetical protein [Candidatus Peregrinibacteria bacterium]